MLSKRWITDLQSLCNKNVTSDDLLLVKLLTVDTYNDGKINARIDICPARIVLSDTSMTWMIYDDNADALCIDTDRNSRDLGVIKIDKNLIHRIIGCQILSIPEEYTFFKITDETGADLIHAATKTEITAIQKTIRAITKHPVTIMET